MEYKNILVVLPHPDDEVFPLSGTLVKLKEEGAHITYMCLTLGEMGRNLGNPPFANRVTLPEIREKELRKSCGVIGIDDLRLMGYHDKTIEFEPYDKIDKDILDAIEEVKPEVIFTFYPGHGVHPDHNACGEAVIRTVGNMKEDQRPDVLCVAFPDRDIGEPDHRVDISPWIEKKISALRAHSTQFRIPTLENRESKSSKEFIERIQEEVFWKYKFK
jgi:bacillithiol biosynthesis deacetylase BshB2